jgi:seryl-tRNA synthetase
MLDIRDIRRQPVIVQTALDKRDAGISVADFLKLDAEKLQIQTELENIKHYKNEISQQISTYKKQNQDVTTLLKQVREVGQQIGRLEKSFAEKQSRLQELWLQFPNLPDEDILAGGKEANQVLYAWKGQPSFCFSPLSHMELADRHQLIDYKTGSTLIGSGFWIYRGLGARLEWALLNYCLSENQKAGYEMLMLPPVASNLCGFGAGQFPKFEDEVYKLQDEEKFLIPTAETLLVNLHQNETLKQDELPLKYTAYTPCFRKEVSKNPKEKGLIRGHQFNKVEMVQFTTKEQSGQAFDELLQQAEHLMQGLDLHYRVVKLAAQECGAAMARTYDIEVWLPAEQMYIEVSSVSNARAYQARRTNTRYKDEKGRIEYVHTLNGSGLATSRLFAAVLEQHQQADGSIQIPEMLEPFFGNNRLQWT